MGRREEQEQPLLHFNFKQYLNESRDSLAYDSMRFRINKNFMIEDSDVVTHRPIVQSQI